MVSRSVIAVFICALAFGFLNQRSSAQVRRTYLQTYPKPDRELVDACSAGKLDEVKRLIEQGAPVSVEAFTAAVLEAQREVVLFLLEKGAPADGVTLKRVFSNLWTPGSPTQHCLVVNDIFSRASTKDSLAMQSLLWAALAFRCDEPFLQSLLTHLPKPDSPSLLRRAVDSNHTAALQLFLKKGIVTQGDLRMVFVDEKNHHFSRRPLAFHEFLIKQPGVVQTVEEKNDLLCLALQRNQSASAKLFLEAGADPARRTSEDRWPLLCSQSGIDLDTIKFMLARGANLRQRDQSGFTVLHTRAARENLTIAKFLVEAGADIHALDVGGRTVAHHANSEVVRYLVDRGVKVVQEKDYGESVFSLALERDDTDLAEFLLKKGANLYEEDSAGALLIERVVFNRPKAALFLLDRMDPNARTKAGVPILHRLAMMDYGHDATFPAIKKLLDRGADPGVRAPDGTTFLQAAAEGGDVNLVRYIVEKFHPDVNERSSPGLATAIERAVAHHEDLVQYLVEQGARLDQLDPQGRSLLKRFMEVRPLKSDFVRDYLIKKGVRFLPSDDINGLVRKITVGADYEVMGNDGMDLRDDDVSFLLSQGADVRREDDEGVTILHLAVANGVRLNVIQELIKKGADPEAVDNRGKTPHEYATVRTSQEVLELLKSESKNSLLPGLWERYVVTGKVKDKQEENRILWVLAQNFATGKKVSKPPKTASDRTKRIYANLDLARRAPHALTAKTLDVDAPAGYFWNIVRAARGREARASGVFRPSAVQAKKVLRHILEDPRSSDDDFEAVIWLLTRSGVEVDESLLKVFSITVEKLRSDVDALLGMEPLKYRGNPDLAAIKLAKAFLSIPEEELVCSLQNVDDDDDKAVGFQNHRVSNILTWFESYGDLDGASRGLFAKLGKLILDRGKLCSRDRNHLLNAMRAWRSTDSSVQYSLICAMNGASALEPIKTRPFEQILLASKIYGLMAPLSQSAWMEQMRAFGQLRSGRGGAMNESDAETHLGLLKYAIGMPPGKLAAERVKVNIPAEEPKPKTFIKLCDILARKWKQVQATSATEEDASALTGINLWLQVLRENLDRPRPWPVGFTPVTNETLREAFIRAGMKEDLAVIESNCGKAK